MDEPGAMVSSQGSAKPAPRRRSSWAVGLAFAACLPLGLAGWSLFRFGSVSYGLAYLKGSRIQVTPGDIWLGDRTAGEKAELSIRVRNHSATPLKILGAYASCSCLATQGLPIEIPAGGEGKLTVTVAFGAIRGESHQLVNYFTDRLEQRAFRVALGMRVAK